MELSIRAVLLGIGLSLLLGAANAYLGLKVGMTVSASIPAAVISFAVLRWFRQANILENNLIQTAASAGESLAAGMIFTLPALIMLGAWQAFDYIQGTLLIILGGILGVLIAVPLRRALLDHPELTFPEGVATAEVLKAGYSRRGAVKFLISGGLIAAGFKLLQSGFGIAANSISGAYYNSKILFGFGADLSAALVAVGFIVRMRIASLMMIGGVLVWIIIMPIYSYWQLNPATLNENQTAMGLAFNIWSTDLRFIGVGAMLVAGFWVLLLAIKPVWHSLATSLKTPAVKNGKDFSTKTILISIGLMIVPIVYVQSTMIDYWSILIFALLYALVASFLFSTVAAYMAGLVGSSNNPISGVTIATIFIAALMIYFLLHLAGDGELSESNQLHAGGLTILIATIVCCAAAISGDTMQDLKAGQIVGATPKLQTWMQIIGVLAAGLILLPILTLLFEAYGFVGFYPREGMDASQALAAPQASLMKSVALGVFNGDLKWGLIYLGAAIAVVIILIDLGLRWFNKPLRLPVMAVAVGMYLPVTLSVPIFIGGLIAQLVDKSSKEKQQDATLFASGLIAGEALIGILLAIPFALLQDTSYFHLTTNRDVLWISVVGIVMLGYTVYKLWRSGVSD